MHDVRPFMRRFGWPVDKGILPFTIAHRGASGHARENTLAAFRLGSELGAEMWELDTQLTRDGVVVVSHDDHLLRVFGIDAHISELTLPQLQALKDTDIPTFEAVAALARSLGTGLYVELKAPGTGPLCWRMLQRENQRFAALGSFDVDQVRQLRDMACDVPLSVLVRVGHDPFALADRAGADVIHLCWERAGDRPQDLVTPELMRRAFDGNREIVLWHEERPPILADIMALPVLGICTDLPDLMRPTAV